MPPLVWIFIVAAVFLVVERVLPGRELPASPGWYLRAALLNAAQLGVVIVGGITWSVWLQGPSLLHIADQMHPLAQGFVCWFVGTFMFYWWHRARHRSNFLWLALHQIHHSPTRIETLTAFYKHPLEITINSILSTAIVFVLLGASVEASGWYSFFAALGEFFYHSNVRTPLWWGYFFQRPEQHSVHHQKNVHDFNYGDITWWDRMFGTFREAEHFVPQCGYAGTREQRLPAMLLLKDVNPPGVRNS